MILKSPTLLLAAVLATPVFALTPDEITPAALFGKTITFTASAGTGLLPTSGSWTGKCGESPARTFSISNTGSGIVENHNTSYTAVSSSDTTLLSLGSAYLDSGSSTLSLSISGGQGIYVLSCVRVALVGGLPVAVTATQTGSFSFNSSTVLLSEISVKDGTANLIDGSAKSNFGTVKVGKKSAPRSYRITNTGKASLSGIKVVTTGSNKADFIISNPGVASLAPGASTTFRVSFKPAKKGPRSAAILIASNDADENPFDITLSGLGKK